MKTTAFLLIIPALIIAFTANGQFKNNIDDWVQLHIHNAKILADTRAIFGTLRDTKRIIGTTAATINDLKELSKQMDKDLRNISFYSKTELQEVIDIFNFKDAIAGRGYPSLFNATDWYINETKRFRNAEGNLDVTASILNEYIANRSLKTLSHYNIWNNQMPMYEIQVLDRQIAEYIHTAQKYERMARIRIIYANIYMFNNSVNNVFKANISIKLPELKDTNSKPHYTDKEIKEMFIDKAYDYLAKSNEYKMRAFDLFSQLQRLQEPLINRAKDIITANEIMRMEKILSLENATRGNDIAKLPPIDNQLKDLTKNLSATIKLN